MKIRRRKEGSMMTHTHENTIMKLITLHANLKRLNTHTHSLDVVVHTFNLTTQEAEEERSL